MDEVVSLLKWVFDTLPQELLVNLTDHVVLYVSKFQTGMKKEKFYSEKTGLLHNAQ